MREVERFSLADDLRSEHTHHAHQEYMSTAQRQVTIGVEIESFSISQRDLHIGCDVSRPRPGLSEAGERFCRDETIGSEYNSRPFSTVREALFLLKTGLRKYLRGLYRSRMEQRDQLVPLFVGGWTDRFAGTHLHLSIEGRELSFAKAKSLSFAIHDHLPLLLALGANSPVFRGRITENASNRMCLASDRFFAVQRRGQLAVDTTTEMCFVPERADKPPTLELRVLDSNIPEYVVTCLCLTKAVAMSWLRRKPAVNRLSHEDYLRARQAAARHGVSAELCWRGEWVPTSVYLDRFIEAHRAELESMDIPDEIFRVLRLLKIGYNGARIIGESIEVAREEHPRSWRRHFAGRYVEALEDLLSGNTFDDFAQILGVPLPETSTVWLGREDASIDE